MDLVLKRTGHAGGGNLASAYSHYGQRVSGPQVGAIAVMGRHGGGHVGVVSGVDPNGNPIIVSGNHGYAMGVLALDMDYAGGDLTSVTNSGTIHAASQYAWGEGMFVGGEKVSVSNAATGTVEAIGLDWAAGIEVQGDAATANNLGTVTAHTFGPGFSYAVGITGFAYDALAITNAGTVDASTDGGVAKGIAAYGYGTVVVQNTHGVSASAYGYATGIHGEAFDTGTVSISSSGDIAATSVGNGQATGIYGYGGSAITVGNTGHVTASAHDLDAFAIGIYGEDAAVSVTNGGTLTAQSTNGNATGIFAYGDATTVSNTKTIDALGHDAAFGIQAGAYATVSVSGNGTIHATANQYALGIGADGDIANVNVGGTTIATADEAIGIRASGHTSASVSTTGTVTATGISQAIGAQVESDASSFHNTNVVRATASGGAVLGGVVGGVAAGKATTPAAKPGVQVLTFKIGVEMDDGRRLIVHQSELASGLRAGSRVRVVGGHVLALR